MPSRRRNTCRHTPRRRVRRSPPPRRRSYGRLSARANMLTEHYRALQRRRTAATALSPFRRPDVRPSARVMLAEHYRAVQQRAGHMSPAEYITQRRHAQALRELRAREPVSPSELQIAENIRRLRQLQARASSTATPFVPDYTHPAGFYSKPPPLFGSQRLQRLGSFITYALVRAYVMLTSATSLDRRRSS
jgi:hypothetical protein